MSISRYIAAALTVFYHDAHLTTEGARVVAEKIYEYLKSAPGRKQSSRMRVGLDPAESTLHFLKRLSREQRDD